MKFHYRGRDTSGQMKTGQLEAADRAAAIGQLQQAGVLVSELKPAGISLDMEINLNLSRARRRVTTADLALFCDQLACLLGAGVPILQSLKVMGEQFKGRKLGQVVAALIADLESGDSLSQAMRRQRAHLPATMVYITAVAEVAGRLDEAYVLLAKQFDEEEQLVRKVKSAMTYPVIVVVVAIAVLIFMLTFVLPTYAGMFREMGATMPASTRALIAVSDFMRQRWYLIPVPVVALWWGGRQLLRQPAVHRRVDQLSLRIPLLGPLRYKRELARLCRTLATMNRSGVPLMAALLTVKEALEFQPLAAAVDNVQGRVADGESFGEALRAQPFFDRITVEMIALGEQAGTLETMLFKVAAVADKDVNLLLDRLTALLEPAMTMLIGSLVVSILIPMLLPMFDILGQVH
jgi:type IV pilus assembly protein PilC